MKPNVEEMEILKNKLLFDRLNSQSKLSNIHIKNPLVQNKRVIESNIITDKPIKASKREQEAKYATFKRINNRLELQVKYDKSDQDLQNGIIDPVQDTRSTSEKLSDDFTLRKLALENSITLFGDRSEAGTFLSLIQSDLNLLKFYVQHFPQIYKDLKDSTKLLDANYLKRYLDKFEKIIAQTGGIESNENVIINKLGNNRFDPKYTAVYDAIQLWNGSKYDAVFLNHFYNKFNGPTPKKYNFNTYKAYVTKFFKFYNEFYDKMTTYKMPYPDAIDLIASVKRLQPKKVEFDIEMIVAEVIDFLNTIPTSSSALGPPPTLGMSSGTPGMSSSTPGMSSGTPGMSSGPPSTGLLSPDYDEVYNIVDTTNINSLNDDEVKFLAEAINGTSNLKRKVNVKRLNEVFDLYGACYNEVINNPSDPTTALNNVLSYYSLDPNFYERVKDVMLAFTNDPNIVTSVNPSTFGAPSLSAPSGSSSSSAPSGPASTILTPDDENLYKFANKEVLKAKLLAPEFVTLTLNLGYTTQGSRDKNKKFIKPIIEIFIDYYDTVNSNLDQSQASIDFLNNKGLNMNIINSIQNALMSVYDPTKYDASYPTYESLTSATAPTAPTATTPPPAIPSPPPMVSGPASTATATAKLSTLLTSDDYEVYNFLNTNSSSNLSDADIEAILSSYTTVSTNPTTNKMNIDYEFGTLRQYYTEVESSNDEIDASNEFLRVNTLSLGSLNAIRDAILNFINTKKTVILGVGLSKYFQNVKSKAKPIISKTKSNISNKSHSLVNYFKKY
jgi:hypothetical protein